MENGIIVEGYLFTDGKTAAQARKEAEGIRYVKSRTDLTKPEQVFNVYHRLIDQNMFQTPVGYQYLKELQEYLKAEPGIHEEDVRPVPVESKVITSVDKDKVSKVWKRRLEQSKQKLRISHAANVVFVLAIIAMFAINLFSSNNTNILNYENEIQDKYSDWEQELQEREERVREKELQLQLNGDSLSDDLGESGE